MKSSCFKTILKGLENLPEFVISGYALTIYVDGTVVMADSQKEKLNNDQLN